MCDTSRFGSSSSRGGESVASTMLFPKTRLTYDRLTHSCAGPSGLKATSEFCTCTWPIAAKPSHGSERCVRWSATRGDAMSIFRRLRAVSLPELKHSESTLLIAQRLQIRLLLKSIAPHSNFASHRLFRAVTSCHRGPVETTLRVVFGTTKNSPWPA